MDTFIIVKKTLHSLKYISLALKSTLSNINTANLSILISSLLDIPNYF